MDFEKNIPIPKRSKYVASWEYMEVGDSVYFDDCKTADSAGMSLRQYIRVHKLSWKITIRKENTGKRIWRTE